MTITKVSPSIAVTAEEDLTEATVKEAMKILQSDSFITTLIFTSGGITVTLTLSGNTLTITNATGSTTASRTEYVAIQKTIIAYLDL